MTRTTTPLAALAIAAALLLGCSSGRPLRVPGPDAAVQGDAALEPRDVPLPIDGPGATADVLTIGQPCNVTVDAGPGQVVYNGNARECQAGQCLKPVVQPGALLPTSPTGALCTAECSQDSDCVGELRDPGNPLDTRCSQGFACGVPFVVGPLCCKKMCMCKDSLGPTGASTPVACQGDGAASCAVGPTSGNTGVIMQNDLYLSIAPPRVLDLVFMVDNSPSMGPKVAKLNAQFPSMLQALQDPQDGTLPDLRVAVIDSDLGTGCAYPGGNCGPKHWDGSGCFGDQGKFQMLTSPTACTFDSGASFLEVRGGKALNFPASPGLSQVLSCLTANLGTLGCGQEHSLQAFEFALAAKGVGNEQQQADFLRRDAYLGLVFLTDEDDCSAASNLGMFGDKPELRGESASLRCATRAHRCGGLNLADGGPGYPTTQSYSHPFNDCHARTDACPNPTDTSRPTSCSPHESVRRIASEIKALKADPDRQILVAGIFGWPLNEVDMANAEYKIAPAPNPNTLDLQQHPTVFDAWPICYDPDHLPSPTTIDPATGFDRTAAEWGATAGLRNAAFIDEFGENGLKYSICERDYSRAMSGIGNAFPKMLQNHCSDFKLVDSDRGVASVQPTCRVVWRFPVADPNDPTRTVYQESPASLPYCPAGATHGRVAEDCWRLLSDWVRCPTTGQLILILRTAEEIAAQPRLPPGTKVAVQCLACPPSAPGTPVVAGCEYYSP